MAVSGGYLDLLVSAFREDFLLFRHTMLWFLIYCHFFLSLGL